MKLFSIVKFGLLVSLFNFWALPIFAQESEEKLFLLSI